MAAVTNLSEEQMVLELCAGTLTNIIIFTIGHAAMASLSSHQLITRIIISRSRNETNGVAWAYSPDPWPILQGHPRCFEARQPAGVAVELAPAGTTHLERGSQAQGSV